MVKLQTYLLCNRTLQSIDGEKDLPTVHTLSHEVVGSNLADLADFDSQGYVATAILYSFFSLMSVV